MIQPQVISQTEHDPSIQNAHRQSLSPKIVTRQVSSHLDLYLKPPPRPPDLKEKRWDLIDLDMDNGINIDFEENSPNQQGIITERYERPDNSYVKEPPELGDLLDTSKLVQKFLPRQTDIDKILEIIQRKVLKGTHLPILVKEIQAGYLTRPYFKDLYINLAENKLLSKKSPICKVEAIVENSILLYSLLFKLVTMPEKEAALLAIPEICVNKIIILYHSSLFYRTSGSDKNIYHNRGQVLYTQADALFEIFHKRMLYMSISEKGQTTNKATTD